MEILLVDRDPGGIPNLFRVVLKPYWNVMKLDEVIALLAAQPLFEIRENAKEDGDIRACVEQDRGPHAVCLLHDSSPGQPKRQENSKKYEIIRCIGYSLMQQSEHKDDQ